MQNLSFQSVNGGPAFTCQHGPAECKGNMIQSCALYALNEFPDSQMAFVKCQMKLFADPSGSKVTWHYPSKKTTTIQND